MQEREKKTSISRKLSLYVVTFSSAKKITKNINSKIWLFHCRKKKNNGDKGKDIVTENKVKNSDFFPVSWMEYVTKGPRDWW